MDLRSSKPCCLRVNCVMLLHVSNNQFKNLTTASVRWEASLGHPHSCSYVTKWNRLKADLPPSIDGQPTTWIQTYSFNYISRGLKTKTGFISLLVLHYKASCNSKNNINQRALYVELWICFRLNCFIYEVNPALNWNERN